MDIPEFTKEIEPLGDRVVVIPAEQEQVTASGIVIPETTDGEKPTSGFVLFLGTGGIGKDCPDPEEFLNIGEEVLFGKYTGDDIKLKTKEGKEVNVKILHLDQVLGVVK